MTKTNIEVSGTNKTPAQVKEQASTTVTKETTKISEDEKNKLKQELLSEIVKEYNIADLIKAEVDKVTSQLKDKKENNNVVDTNSTLEDMLTEPVSFYCFSNDFTVFGGDTIGGAMIPIPFGTPYRFVPLYSYEEKYKDGRGSKRINISTCIEYSKKRVEWMRRFLKHGSGYGKVFEKVTDAMAVDTELSDKISTVAKRINSIDDIKVVQQAKEKGITITTDINALRGQLIQILAKEELANEKRKKTPAEYMKLLKDVEQPMQRVPDVPKSF